MEIIWRPYQERMFQAVAEAMDNGITKHLIVQCTGSGKRLEAVGLSQMFEKTLFICHREELIDQAYVDFNEMYPLQVGIIKGPRFEIENKIVIASVQTLHRRLDRISKDYFDCVICDEFHHFMAETYRKPIDYFESNQMFGFTATPTRLDGLNFSNIVEQITFNYPIQQGINEGWLCSLEAYRVKTQIDLSDIKKVAGDFNQKELDTRVDVPERNELIVKKYLQYGKNRQGVVFCASINHANHVKDAFLEAGIHCETISSLTDPEERKMLTVKFKLGKIQIMTNVNLWTEGWDYNDLGIVMMARPTESLALYMQMIGRGTRLKTDQYFEKFGTRICTILDFVDNVGNHKLVNTWSIEQDTPIEDRVLISDEQKEIYAEKIRKVREARLKELSDKEGKVDLFKLPPRRDIHHNGRLNEPATEKQIEWLQNEGIWTEGMRYTKGQASEFITNLPAKPWMIRNLINWRYELKGIVTIGQYYEVKKQMQSTEN